MTTTRNVCFDFDKIHNLKEAGSKVGLYLHDVIVVYRQRESCRKKEGEISRGPLNGS